MSTNTTFDFLFCSENVLIRNLEFDSETRSKAGEGGG
jgi:hypothetical protein